MVASLPHIRRTDQYQLSLQYLLLATLFFCLVVAVIILFETQSHKLNKLSLGRSVKSRHKVIQFQPTNHQTPHQYLLPSYCTTSFHTIHNNSITTPTTKQRPDRSKSNAHPGKLPPSSTAQYSRTYGTYRQDGRRQQQQQK